MENTQQKLGKRNTYTPLGASQAQGSVAMSLNREETLGEHGLKTFPNSLDVNQQSGKTGQGLRVPVLNMRGEPLMPTTPRKARKLVEQQKAKVLQRTPFVIQLMYPTGETKQSITLGIDSGYNNVGFSAITKKEELVSGELQLRRNISKKLEERRMYRRLKRNKLWYREPRFLNRVKSKKKEWLAPSLQHKLDTHKRLIENIKRWFPITKIVVEVASFDTQKMRNPEIKGVEYQQGELQGYEVREYLLEKWGRKCAYCNKKNVPLEIEHIIPKSRGGTDRVDNLTISCRGCNQKKNRQTAEEFGHPMIQKKAKKTLKATAFMNVIRGRLAKAVDAEETLGYITKYWRIRYNIEKSHINDAFIIAGGSTEKRCEPYMVTQTRRNNRCLQLNRKGFKPAIRKRRYPFQPNDLVMYDGKTERVRGTHSRGRQIRLQNKKSVSSKKVELLSYGKGLVYKINKEVERSIPASPPTPEGGGLPCLNAL